MKIRWQILLVMLLLFAINTLQAKSLPKAMLMSAVLPGTGEIYAGSLTRGVIFTTADLIFLFSTYRAVNEIKWLDNSYKQFALAKVEVPLNSSADYYTLLHRWYGSNEYNADVERYFRNLGLARYNDPSYYNEEILLYSIPDEDAWQWNTETDWMKYRSIRKDKQTQIQNRKLAIGAAVANRIISVLDTTVLIRRKNRSLQTTFSVTPDFINNGAVFNCSLEF